MKKPTLNEEIEKYKVYCGSIQKVNANTTTVKLSGLKPASKYTVTVRGITDNNELTGDPKTAKTNGEFASYVC